MSSMTLSVVVAAAAEAHAPIFMNVVGMAHTSSSLLASGGSADALPPPQSIATESSMSGGRHATLPFNEASESGGSGGSDKSKSMSHMVVSSVQSGEDCAATATCECVADKPNAFDV